jgi:hypothetical protein
MKIIAHLTNPIRKHRVIAMARRLRPFSNPRRLANLIINSDNPIVLAISHADISTAIGGTEMAMRSEMLTFNKGAINYLSIAPSSQNEGAHQGAISVSLNAQYIAQVRPNDLGPLLLHLCHLIVCVHIHPVLHWDKTLLTNILPNLRPRFVRVFTHDFYLSCRHPNLLYNNREHCGSPPAMSTRCQVCISGVDRQAHIKSSITLLNAMRVGAAEFSVISPSQVCADIWSRLFFDYRDSIRVIPHKVFHPEIDPPDTTRRMPNRKLRIAYIGYTEAIKGFWDWWSLARDNSIKDHYEFYHLGAAGLHHVAIREVPVSFVKDGPEAMIHAIRNHQIDVAMLLSNVPETFSFTCAEAIEVGAFIVTSKASGNIAAMVEKFQAGVVINANCDLLPLLVDWEAFHTKVSTWFHTSTRYRAEWNESIALETIRSITKDNHKSQATR